jgi:3'(2'), 5'-bisphosphate nucleotidase
MEELQHKEIFSILAEAGNAILEVYRGNNFNTELKSDNSPVTLADKTSSKIINAGLQKLYPNIPVLDEETIFPDFSIRKNWDSYFLLDPLDGTKEFIKRNGEFCINLALMENCKPIEGWIYQPLLKKGWYCKKGEGIFEFDSTLDLVKLEKGQEKSNNIRIVASRSFFKPVEAEILKEIGKHYSIEIIHQGSSLKQIAIVLNKADLYIKSGSCSEWDTAPGQLMVEEFGGAVLQQRNFETMRYNKSDLINPHFCMFNSRLNNAEFINYIKDIVLKFK